MASPPEADVSDSRKRLDPRLTLLQQLAALRQTIDPAVLERARHAAEGKVTYDREAARAAVRGFLALKTKQDGGRFERLLREAMKREAGAKPAVAAAPAAPPPAPKTPGRRIK